MTASVDMERGIYPELDARRLPRLWGRARSDFPSKSTEEFNQPAIQANKTTIIDKDPLSKYCMSQTACKVYDFDFIEVSQFHEV